MSFEKKFFLKAFVESQFGYCPLTWIFCSRNANSEINHSWKIFKNSIQRQHSLLWRITTVIVSAAFKFILSQFTCLLKPKNFLRGTCPLTPLLAAPRPPKLQRHSLCMLFCQLCLLLKSCLFNSVLLLVLVNFVSGLVYDLYIPHCKYKAKPYAFPCFSAACAAVIVHRHCYFHLHE